MNPELIIEGVSKTYPHGVQALRNVTLNIPAGMFGLLGPNGAGKSTLMRTLATLQEPDTGRIRLGTVDVLKEKDTVRRMLGYLPQEFGVYPKVTAYELLDHFAVLKGILDSRQRKETVEALLERVNLTDVRKRKLGTFSGGMKQRFGIAQALIGDPKLIIVDEPTAGLDPVERMRFNNLLSRISEQVVVILSTHIVDDVSDLCRNMAIIDRGEVLLTGDPLKTIEALRGQVWKKTVARDDVQSYERDCRVISTRLVAGRTQIHVLAPNRPDSSFEEVPPLLEDVYFSTLSRSNEKAA